MWTARQSPPGTPGSLEVRQDRWLPDFRQSVKLKYVKLGYHYLITHLLTLFLVPLVPFTLMQASQVQYDDVYQVVLQLQYHLITLISCCMLLVLGSTFYYLTRTRPVYLIDYACHRPSEARHIRSADYHACTSAVSEFSQSSIDFQRRILERSGLGEETAFPPDMMAYPNRPTIADARAEAAEVIFSALDNLFESTKIKPREIGVLVVNCSLFNPTPSLSAMIVNKYKLRGNIRSFNLGGMGCSAGVIAVDLAKDMLQVHRNTYAVVVSTEILSLNGYIGNHKPMLITNCLFRMGGAAILLSNRSSDKGRAKYKLLHVVRTHHGAHDDAYHCVYQDQDENLKSGVSLSKNLMSVAGNALKTNITTLGPLVLPLSEQLLFFVTLMGKKLINPKIKPYIPDFKLAFEHFCIHAGGRGVIDELEKNLELSKEHVEASRMSLYRFGNTSSSSIWYELAYIEAKGRMKKGNRVWQIGFGSGFKCNSAVWVALRNVKASDRSPWLDCIHKYPVETCA